MLYIVATLYISAEHAGATECPPAQLLGRGVIGRRDGGICT